MKWYVTDGKTVLAFSTHTDAQEYCKTHEGFYEVMS